MFKQVLMEGPSESEDPLWMSGHTGPLRCGKSLCVTLRRNERSTLVAPDYTVDEDEVQAVFNAFLGLRIKYHQQEHASGGTAVHDILKWLRA